MRSCMFVLAFAACASAARTSEDPSVVGGVDAAAAGDGAAASGQDDDHRCGAAERDCTLCGGTCEEGQCTPAMLAENVTPAWIAFDATHVYWEDQLGYPTSASVGAVAKTGGAHTVLATDTLESGGIAVDDDYVYWPHQASTTGGAIMRAPIAGGAPSIVASDSQYWLALVARSGSTLVWRSNALIAGSVTGGATRVLDPVVRQIDSIAVTADRVFYTTYEPTLTALRSVPLAGGPSALVEDCGGTPSCGVSIANDRLCLASYGRHTIETASPPGAPLTVVATPQDGTEVVADATSCYWYDLGPSGSTVVERLMKVDATTGQISTLATRSIGTNASPESLSGVFTVDDRCVYYSTWSQDGSIPTGGHLFSVTK